ncbi:hypothetical protein ACFQYP_65350 [Nonomuraea antimicrobica]
MTIRDLFDQFDQAGEAKGPPHPRNIYELFGAGLVQAQTVLAPETLQAARRLWETVLTVDKTPTAEQQSSPALMEDPHIRWGLAIQDVAGPIHTALKQRTGHR